MITIYCDGACSNNPGAGAWAYVVFENINSQTKQIACATGSFSATTNNRMELMAAIHAIDFIENEGTIILDSQYVRNGITAWVHGWKKNNWKTTAKEPVKNVDLWQILDDKNTSKKITWLWQKGHANSLHDVADEYAQAAVLR